jgi:hypothetical protein
MHHCIMKAEAKATLMLCIPCSGALAGTACRTPQTIADGTMKDT